MAEEKKERLSRQEKKEQQLEAIRKLIEEKGGGSENVRAVYLRSGLSGTQRFVEEGTLERIKSGYYSLGYRKKSKKRLYRCCSRMECCVWRAVFIIRDISKNVLTYGVLRWIRTLQNPDLRWIIRSYIHTIRKRKS